MIDTIIFDLDGLLIDTEIVSYKIYKKILENYGHEFSIQEYSKNFSGKTEKINVQFLIDYYHLPLNFNECMNTVIKIENEYIRKGVNLKKGAKELLNYLKANNYKMAIASSSTKERALNILDSHNITNYFDDFVFAHDVSKGKPNPDIFLKACDKLKSKPNECIVLEDSEAGIEASFDANIPVICIPDMKTPNTAYLNKTLCVLDSLFDVMQYLKDNANASFK